MSERAVKQKKAAATASVIVPFSDSDSAEQSALRAHFRGLRNLAHAAFANRNASGMRVNLALRKRAKALARPSFLDAVRCAQQARTALLAGDIQGFERARDDGRLAYATAQGNLRHAFMEHVSKQIAAGKTGGRPSDDERAVKWFGAFGKASAKLTPQEIYEDIAATWNAKKGRSPVKWTTVRKEIGKHRKRLK